MDISVIIVNWNTCKLIEKCLISLKQSLQVKPELSYEVWVVDNHSSDDSVVMLRKNFKWVNLIANTQNLGFARANNQAYLKSTGNYLLLLNPDTIVSVDCISTLLCFLENHPEVGAVGPRLAFPNGSFQKSIYRFPTLFREGWHLFLFDRILPLSDYSKQIHYSNSPVEVDILMGACVLIKKEIIETIGLFDEQFFVYSEEVDFFFRLKAANWKVKWVPSTQIIHFGGASTQLISDAMFLELYRNRVKLFRKHYGDFYASLYKALLILVSLSRLPLIGLSLPRSPQQHSWKQKSRQYFRLLKEVCRY